MRNATKILLPEGVPSTPRLLRVHTDFHLTLDMSSCARVSICGASSYIVVTQDCKKKRTPACEKTRGHRNTSRNVIKLTPRNGRLQCDLIFFCCRRILDWAVHGYVYMYIAWQEDLEFSIVLSGMQRPLFQRRLPTRCAPLRAIVACIESRD